jgi:hypothetical protein
MVRSIGEKIVCKLMGKCRVANAVTGAVSLISVYPKLVEGSKTLCLSTKANGQRCDPSTALRVTAAAPRPFYKFKGDTFALQPFYKFKGDSRRTVTFHQNQKS